ncbi:beta-glucan synthesis-associated protein-domain-containing protein [Xylogone sp. PMI_703]|nr:beta-glucan synthesis-associated protein-domain-containing protein [Xylogone sp. PMI_703]
MQASTPPPDAHLAAGTPLGPSGVEPGNPSSGLARSQAYTPAVSSPLNPNPPAPALAPRDSDEKAGLIDNGLSLTNSSSAEAARTPNSGNISEEGRLKGKGIGLVYPSQRTMPQSPAAVPGQSSLQQQINPRETGYNHARYSPGSEPSMSSAMLIGPPYLVSNPAASSSSLANTASSNPFNSSQSNLEKLGYRDDGLDIYSPYHSKEQGLIVYVDEIEDDDAYHLPQPDDDIVFKPTWKDYDRKTIISAIGGICFALGLLCLFIVVPALLFTNSLASPPPQSDKGYDGPAWAHVNNETYPLLKNVRRSLIDPATPIGARKRISTFDGSTLNLVFSDEFNDENRTFYPGDDPFWTAANVWYGSTQDLEWYDPVAVTTGGGTLQLRLDSFPNHNLQYQSGMLNSWNQMCFKGGIFEVSVSLAGPAGVPGLWPGAWAMGNLGRPGYKATTEGVWPYTYNSCDHGITPNQSSPDGLSFLPGQKLSACTCEGEDHPSPGTGRGAPEIDIFEGSVDPNNRIGVVTQSAQIAPFDIWYRPNADFMQIPNYNTTQMNTYCGGPYQQAVSGTTLLNNDWYDGKEYQKYAFEYVPGTSEGKIAWFVGDERSFMMDGRAIGPNGNVDSRVVSEEPMSIILNLGISNSWSQVLFDQLKFPTIMHVDYVRIYQHPDQEMLTCDPPGYPTTEYIARHPNAYNNPNLTSWAETGFPWPKNTLMNGCKA